MGAAEDAGPVVNVLFGSATGNAEEIARRVHAELGELGWAAGCIAPLNEFEKLELGARAASRPDDLLLVVVATTGDGDLPANAMRLPRQVKKLVEKNSDALHALRYAVLGLGDSNYENFNNAAKRVDKVFKNAGAQSFFRRTEADDGVGLEVVIEPWRDEFYEYLRAHAPASPVSVKETASEGAFEATSEAACDAIRKSVFEHLLANLDGVPHALEALTHLELADESTAIEQEAAVCVSEVLRAERILRVPVHAARLLSDADLVERRVWHIELDFENSAAELDYAPGDSIGIVVQNRAEDVAELLTRARLPDGAGGPDRLAVLRKNPVSGTPEAACAGPCPVRTMVERLIDLNAPVKKTLLRVLAEHCSDESDARQLLILSSKSGRTEYTEKLRAGKLSILKVLSEFKSCAPSLELLLDQVPPLAPRYYSAASAPGADGARFHFAFSVVQFEDGRRGLATGALEDLCIALSGAPSSNRQDHSPAYVEVVLRPKGTFAPPADDAVPFLMIGPGTGVAPFRGFLRERASKLSSAEGDAGSTLSRGKTMLFFGCRHEQRDFLYRGELEKFVADGTLDALVTAFSRDGGGEGPKVYVQHKMLERADEIAALLHSSDSSRVYVCGDGGGMASAVNDALVQILSEHGEKMSREDAQSRLKQWGKEGRYLRDVWYWGEL